MSDAVEESLRRTTDSKGQLTVVDLGCGDMPYRALFAPHGVHYLGADFWPNAAAGVRIDEEGGTVDLPDQSADIIISTQVLEHVGSPPKYLAEARRVCRPGGRMILSTHGVFKYHPHPVDYRRWTAAGLRRELADAGWRTVRLVGVLGFAAAAFMLLQDAIVTKLPRVRLLRTTVAVGLQQIVGLLDMLYTPEQRQENAAVFLVIAVPDAGPTTPHGVAT